ncbi:hypothetical protein QJS66_22515 [Kocuria rhizophila]|nr:hypothetical protein QJS66_22515 [Kocuria rhizophila]
MVVSSRWSVAATQVYTNALVQQLGDLKAFVTQNLATIGLFVVSPGRGGSHVPQPVARTAPRPGGEVTRPRRNMQTLDPVRKVVMIACW